MTRYCDSTSRLTTTALIATIAFFLLAVASTALAQDKAQPTPSAAGRPSSPTLGKRTDPDVVNVEDMAKPPVPYDVTANADAEMLLALEGWSSKYRIDLDIEDGDWVKYETLGDGPKEIWEIRAERHEAGEVWYIETRTPVGAEKGTETHLKFAFGRPVVLEGFRIHPDGTREELVPIEPLKAGELFMEARTNAQDALGGRTNFRVSDCNTVEELTGPFGTLDCRCVEVRVGEDVDPISFATTRRMLPEGTLIWLNEDVPRLIPMSAVLLCSMFEPDDFMSVRGGLVRSPYHVLIDYKGRAE